MQIMDGIRAANSRPRCGRPHINVNVYICIVIEKRIRLLIFYLVLTVCIIL